MVRSEESAPAPVLLANGTHPGVCRAHRSAASASTMSEDLSDGGDRGDGVRVGSAQPNGLELTLPSFFLALAQISKSPILLRGIRRGRRFGSGTASEVVRFPTSYHSPPSPKFSIYPTTNATQSDLGGYALDGSGGGGTGWGAGGDLSYSGGFQGTLTGPFAYGAFGGAGVITKSTAIPSCSNQQ